MAYPTVNGVRKSVDLQRYLIGKSHNLPDNMKVSIRTTCGNPLCINARHLELAPTTLGKPKGTRHIGTKTTNVELNMSVFKLLVTAPLHKVHNAVGVSNVTVKNIVKNKAMLPYFQLCIQWHTGLSLAELKELKYSDEKYVVNHRLSAKAIEFIRGVEEFNISDEELYLDLLKHCEVVGDHLVWRGEFEDDKPVLKTFGGLTKDAEKLMYSAVTGIKRAEVACTCGMQHCINPYHME